jgi:hypothetical protein
MKTKLERTRIIVGSISCRFKIIRYFVHRRGDDNSDVVEIVSVMSLELSAPAIRVHHDERNGLANEDKLPLYVITITIKLYRIAYPRTVALLLSLEN